MGILHVITFVVLAGSAAPVQYQPQQPKAGESVKFEAARAETGKGRIASCEWTFGDDTRAWTTGATWNHVYDEPGEYAVTLTTTSADGSTDTITAWVRVTGKEFMLTFDDGPTAEATPYILDQLREIRKADGTPVKAGFFLIGADKSRTAVEDIWQSRYGTFPEPGVLSHPDIVRRIAAAGHFIGIHTQHHADLSKIEPADVEREVLDCYEALRRVGVKAPKIFRSPHMHDPRSLPPGLAGWQIVRGEMTQDYLPLTWEGPVTDTCRKILRGKTGAPAIFAFHDFRALPGHRLDFRKIVKELVEQDHFVLVDFDAEVAVAAAKLDRPESHALEDIADMTRIWRLRLLPGPDAAHPPDR
jgi:peptidoglycan/xylan/chitin deacetylase (PgdA/CDA1 family)